jgi:hypothetical protein
VLATEAIQWVALMGFSVCRTVKSVAVSGEFPIENLDG